MRDEPGMRLTKMKRPLTNPSGSSQRRLNIQRGGLIEDSEYFTSTYYCLLAPTSSTLLLPFGAIFLVEHTLSASRRAAVK
jgi:hypothetical protein